MVIMIREQIDVKQHDQPGMLSPHMQSNTHVYTHDGTDFGSLGLWSYFTGDE